MEEQEISKRLELLAQSNEELKMLITSQAVSQEWINKELVSSFMGYGSSQMGNILKGGSLEYTKIGRRTFISRKSLNEFLNQNRANGNQ